MRIRPWLPVTALLVSVLAGCSAPAPPDPEPPSGGSVPWPGEASPGFYMVSREIQEFCPNGEEYLGGEQIAAVIPEQEFDQLTGHACVFAEPASGSPDEIDEFAYRVDEGLGDLVRAYAATTYAFDGPCERELPADARYPQVRVEYDGVGYTLTAAGCGDADALDAAVSGLRVTEVARDTATFDDAQEQGF